MKQPHDYAAEAITELHVMVGWLAESLAQGVDKPIKAPTLNLDLRLARREEQRAERLERVDIAPGEAPIPMDPDVAETIDSVITACWQIHDRVCLAAGITNARRPYLALSDPRPTLVYVRRLLPDIARDTPTLQWVEDMARQLIDEAAEALALTDGGQVIRALCPWCKGKTEHAPVGGEYTLRIRTPKNLDTAVVVCEGGMCEPPEAECGHWVRGNPAWIQAEWEWLAQRLELAS